MWADARPPRLRFAARRPHTLHASLCAALFATSCAGCDTPAATTPIPPPAPKPLKLIVSGDTRGWLVPCGCTSNQSGGLLRRATYIDQQRGDFDVVVADAGGAPGGDSTYDRLRLTAILQGERRMGRTAHNLGGPELVLGADWLRSADDLYSANVADAAGQPIARSEWAEERGVLLVGVVSPSCATADVRVSDPTEAVLRVWAEQRSADRRLIVLAWMPEPEVRELAHQLPEADAVIGSFPGQALAPEKFGRTWIAMAANKGKFLIEMTLAEGEWSGRVVEVSADFADHPEQLENLAAFRRELEQRDIAATETSFVPDRSRQIPDDHRVAGSESCKDCHTAEWEAWSPSGHAHAWQTLIDHGAHVDAACQACHTTGFGMPDGFASLKRSPHRVDVGCETCHGPSARHVEDSSLRTPFRAADQCVTCHDAENSPQFDYAAYWDRIRHGARQTEEASR
jgi:hypothetical protein